MLGDAPVWYSKAEQVAREKLPGSASGDSILATLRNAGVKAQEMEWLGLDEKLRGRPKVSKEEVLKLIGENGVELKETTLGDDEGSRPAKFDRHDLVLPGEKSNYREMLIQLPPRVPAGDIIGTGTHTGETYYVPGKEPRTFHSSHFDEPNILAHTRFDDRITADGKRTLLLEEVQSDWHQKGRKQGYTDSAAAQNARKLKDDADLARQRLFPLIKAADDLGFNTTKQALDAIKFGNLGPEHLDPRDMETLGPAMTEYRSAYEAFEKVRDVATSGVPNAPFKSDWHELVVKRMLRYAAERGYDSLSWVTGEQTAARYDLSKQISRIDWFSHPDLPGAKGRLLAYDHDGRAVIDQQLNENELPDYIGKEPAHKLLNSGMEETGRESHKAISGLDLKVGGEWAHNLYDRAIVSFVNKFVKRYGIKAGETYIPGAPTKVHTVPITPEMRRSIMKEGVPIAKNEPSPLTARQSDEVAV